MTTAFDMMAFADAVARINAAATFGELAGATSAQHAYRELAKIVHPDAAAGRPGATDAFARLAELYANRARTRPLFATGDVAQLYDGGDVLYKVPRDPADNDLMRAEAEALTALWTRGDPRFRPYAPRLVETFTHEDDQRRRRVVNVVERQVGCLPLDEVLRRKGALDPRDAAWMWRRVLVALGWAHRAGVIHGAVLPRHVLIHPEDHGVVLVDWCYAGRTPQAVVQAERDAYPPEVLLHRRAGPATDIFMAAGLLSRLLGPRRPVALHQFIRGCRYESARMRPQDAWALLDEFDDVLHELYGPRQFRPFTL